MLVTRITVLLCSSDSTMGGELVKHCIGTSLWRAAQLTVRGDSGIDGEVSG